MEQNDKPKGVVEELIWCYVEKISQTYIYETADSVFYAPYTKAFFLSEFYLVLIERLFPKAYAKFVVKMIFKKIRRKTIKYFFLKTKGKRVCSIHQIYHAANSLLKISDEGIRIQDNCIEELLKYRALIHENNSMKA